LAGEHALRTPLAIFEALNLRPERSHPLSGDSSLALVATRAYASRKD
jgi:hypothetical protein